MMKIDSGNSKDHLLLMVETLKERSNDVVFFEKYFKIRDRETSNIIPFKVNKSQKRLIYIVEKWERGKDNRTLFIIVLKARKEGFSTCTEAIFFKRLMFQKNKTAMVVSYDDDSARYINSIADGLYQYLPDGMKPDRRLSRGTGILLENPKYDPNLPTSANNDPGLQSQFLIETARNVNAGSAFTINYLHLCMHKDSKIVLSDGSTKAIKDIDVGDTVITSSGRTSEVSNKFYVGEKQTYAIKTWMSNESIAVTAEHKILTDKGYKRCDEIIVSDDWIQIPKIELTNEIKSFVFDLPNKERNQGGGSQHDEHIEFDLNYESGYFLGYYLAEGHIPKHSRKYPDHYQIVLASHINENYMDNIIPFVSARCKSYKIKEEPESNRKIMTIYSKCFAEAVNIICGRVETKQIPEWFFKTNKDFIKGVLAGYYSGDGSKTKCVSNGKYKSHYITATSVHEKISRQLKRLIMSLDFGVPSVRFCQNRERYGKKTKDVYVVAGSGLVGKHIEDLIGNSNDANIKSHINKYKQINGKYYVKIKSIDAFEVSDVYDIEVNHPDHNFETPIGIVSNSELSKWNCDVEATLTSLLQAVPSTNSIVIVESTALGYNYFKDLWDRAIKNERKGRYGYVPIFVPWFDDEGYSFPYSGFELTKDEKELKRLYRLTNDQLEWRRWCIETKCDGDINRFFQEYPSTDKESFLSTGLSVFDKQKLNKRYETLRQYYENSPLTKGHFTFQMKDGLINDSTITFVSDEPKYITIYNKPKSGYPYVIGGDVAEGGADKLAGQVISNRDGTQSAVLHGYMDTDYYAKQMYCLGKYYNMALIAIEANFNKVPIKVLQDLLYWNMYKREVVDSIDELRQEKYGFITDRFTRPIIIDLLKSVVRDSVDTLSDLATIDEMFTFVYNKLGRPEAEAGKHDDLVMALAIAHHARSQMWTDINEEYSFKNMSMAEKNTADYDDDDDIQDNSTWFD